MSIPAGTHPVQGTRWRHSGCVPIEVSTAAFEVYQHVHQGDASVKAACERGFWVQELIPLLYARAFPKEEWRQRWQEGMKNAKL